MAPGPGKPLRAEPGWAVLYDADCGFCKWILAALLRWDRAGRLRPIALQRPDAGELLADLTDEERMASWHLISPTGGRWSAGDAVAPLFFQLPGGRFAAAPFAALPGLTNRLYRWVADHRTGISKLVPGRSKERAGELVGERERAGSHRPAPPTV